MIYNLEKEMTPIVLKWLRERCVHVETELGVGYCSLYVPDVVGCNFDEGKLSAWKRQSPMGRRRIEKLVNEGRPPESCCTDFIAIELKLNNFPDAYFQAKTYNLLGFQAYIAMPQKRYFSLSCVRRKVLEMDGIGFIGITKGEECKVMQEAKPPQVFDIVEKIQITERLTVCFQALKGR